VSEPTLADLIRRVHHARQRLGPRNPYRILLDECVAAIYAVVRQYGDLQEQYAASARVDAAVVGDRGAGGAAPQDVGGDSSGGVHRLPDPDAAVVTVTDGTVRVTTRA